MNNTLRIFLLWIFTFSLFNLALVPQVTFAELSCDFLANSHLMGDTCYCDDGYTYRGGACVEFTCEWVPNSHPEGKQCICDDNYRVENGQCVLTHCEDFPNSHPEGRDCVCDKYFKAQGGQCVAMDESEICPFANMHQEGDKCKCNEGFAFIGEKCLSKYEFCAMHHATWSDAINDCKCNKGYIENDAQNECLPVSEKENSSGTEATAPTPPPAPAAPPVTAPGPSIPNPTSPVPQPGSESGNTNPPVTTPQTTPPPLDPAQILQQLNSDPANKIKVNDAIQAALKDANKEAADLAQKQQEAINSYVTSDEGEYSLPPTSEQKMNVIKGAVVQSALDAEKTWQEQLKKAEATGDIKNESDKQAYEDLKKQEQALLASYKQNQDALNNMGKQTLQIMTLPTLPSVPNAEPVLVRLDPNVPQRNFLKDAKGDQDMALVYAAQATSAQMTLLQQIKDDIRKVNEQKKALLNVPPKPDTEAKLQKEGEKMGWEKNWYK